MKVLLISTMMLVLSCAAMGETLNMPRDLVEQANARGCEQVHDFFDRPGTIDPPYVYLHKDLGGFEEDFALWCADTSDDVVRYVLLVVTSSDHAFGACPERIAYWNYPGGLAIDTRHDVDLAQFTFVNEPERRGPSVTVGAIDVLVSSYDGVEFAFICHDGDWLYRARH